VAFFLIVIITLISTNMWSLIWLSNFIFPGFKIEINAVLVVNFLISIGFAVEFCIHTILRYRKAKGNYYKKISSAIEDVVSVVFKGIFLTKFIGLSVLYFSPIPLFVLYYFRVYYIMILTCGFYGLIATPILLDVFGRFAIKETQAHRKSLNDYLNQVQEVNDAV
jgi:Niemann-Pick C1 protein